VAKTLRFGAVQCVWLHAKWLKELNRASR
jgi:hypothetical protein